MKVFDLFTYFNENDLLEIRLKYLNDSVDYFVICESNYSFSGNPKPYNLELSWERFKSFHDKIIYIKIDQDPSKFLFRNVDRYDPTNGPFQMEHEQRSYLNAIDHMIGDDDLCLVGDLDEIPDKQTINNIKNVNDLIGSWLSEPHSVLMNFFAYYLNNLTVSGPDVKWINTIS